MVILSIYGVVESMDSITIELVCFLPSPWQRTGDMLYITCTCLVSSVHQSVSVDVCVLWQQVWLCNVCCVHVLLSLLSTCSDKYSADKYSATIIVECILWHIMVDCIWHIIVDGAIVILISWAPSVESGLSRSIH